MPSSFRLVLNTLAVVLVCTFLYAFKLAQGTYTLPGEGGWRSVNVRLFTVLDERGRVLNPGWSLLRAGSRSAEL
jgi:hypothetical protein